VVVAATTVASNLSPDANRRDCRRATPATLTGVDGRSIRAWALSTPSETPRCSDQLNDSSATHATVEVAIAVRFKATFMDFLHRFTPHFETARPRSA
jgi:hypothetical protein